MDSWLVEHIGSILVGLVVATFGVITTINSVKTNKNQQLAEKNAQLRSELHKKEHEEYRQECQRLRERVNHTTHCQFAIFDGLQELGVNGNIKKRMNELKEQVIND